MRSLAWIVYIPIITLGVSQDLRKNDHEDDLVMPAGIEENGMAIGTQEAVEQTLEALAKDDALAGAKVETLSAQDDAGTQEKVKSLKVQDDVGTQVDKPQTVAVAVDAKGGLSSNATGNKFDVINGIQSVLIEALDYAAPALPNRGGNFDWRTFGTSIEKFMRQTNNAKYGILLGAAAVEFFVCLAIWWWCFRDNKYRKPGQAAYDFEPVPMCSCCKSCSICCATMFCHPFMWAKTLDKQNYMPEWAGILLQFVFGLLGAIFMGPPWLFTCILRCYFRRQIRLDTDQSPNNCNDCLMHCCCSPCAVQQEAEYIELKKPQSRALLEANEGESGDSGPAEGDSGDSEAATTKKKPKAAAKKAPASQAATS